MFDKYQHISDELLAAFLDGNTTAEENQFVADVMANDGNLMEIADITNDMLSFEDKIAVLEGDFGFWELGIPPVFEPEELLGNVADCYEEVVDVFSEISFNYGCDDDFNLNTSDDNSTSDDFNMDDTFSNDII